MRDALRLLSAVYVASTIGCTSFANVRSAEVRPGPSFSAQWAAAGRPGSVAGYLWAYDNGANYNTATWGLDLSYGYGWRNKSGSKALALSAGFAGNYFYADGFAQLVDGDRPFGIGLRAGLPLDRWREHQLYARYDVPLGTHVRLLLNPALVLHEGTTTHGWEAGSFKGFVQGVGLQVHGPWWTVTPGFAIVTGRAEYTQDGARVGPASVTFPTVSLGFTINGRRWHRSD